MKLGDLAKSIGAWPLRIAQGALVGAGAILPGVSGGVLCVVFGIYEPMIALLSHPIKSFRIYYKLFIPFLIGWLSGFLLLAKAVDALFSASSSVALMLFLGLICGTFPELMKNAEVRDSRQSWSPFVVALAAACLLFNMMNNGSAVSIQPSAMWYAFCGAVWGLSLVVPGLSSSSLLILMGLYQPMTAGIAAMDFSVILPLLGGMILVVALTARLVNMLFERHNGTMLRIILGIAASTLLILPDSFDNVGALLLSLACFAGGFALARGMDITKRGGRQDAAPTTD